ncbi:putative peptidase family-domain-containing protein [Kockovaella imperatae]|uniref:Putative peptidase family-domain-containing protein n=1 Tax=Kockovaella imperatae TaxID=4999 RepID=A0A1Y1UDN2_9TREE|nr:putative peptidase family-domain-containing protein [Kockovaella imperatae]ORX36143.1 putative peptidase family-domain-containing protein [Kockovaella imperatae]
MLFSQLIPTALIGSTSAAPVNVRAFQAYSAEVTIHESCNATQRHMLSQALTDTWSVASVAREYVITNGPSDPVFEHYFGNATEAYATVVGIWDSFLNGNKQGVLLRCDNPDDNCQNEGWAGHWRGENGSTETVICDLSYRTRLFNPAFCMNGFNLITAEKISIYWSIDLIHRLFHVPSVTNGLVEHYASDYTSVRELAQHNSSFAAVDSDALQYFAAHVWAIEVAGGGSACVSDQSTHDDNSDHNDATTSVTASVPPPPVESTGCVLHDDHYHCSSPATTAVGATSTTRAAKECHTHSDGTQHCV